MSRGFAFEAHPRPGLNRRTTLLSAQRGSAGCDATAADVLGVPGHDPRGLCTMGRMQDERHPSLVDGGP